MIYAESKCRSRSVLRKHASSCGHGTLICFMHQRGPTLDPLFIYLSLYTSLYTSLSIPLYIHKGRRQVRQHGGSANMIMNANIILNPGPFLSIPLYIQTGGQQIRQHGGSANMIINANIMLNPGPFLSIPLYIQTGGQQIRQHGGSAAAHGTAAG